MFRRFIVATDLSLSSFSVVSCIGGLHAFGARECLLLQCLNLPEKPSAGLSHATDSLKANMAEQKRILEDLGFSTTERVVTGPAKTEINRIAREEKYSLIVVGSCGETLLGEMFLGGVADAVIHHATKPVLLLRIQKENEEEAACCQSAKCDFAEHVLFPTDFSDNASQAFPYVEKIVSDGAQRVTLLHVQDKTHIDPHLRHRLDEFNATDLERLEKLKQRLLEKGAADIDTQVVYGHPVREILRAIREKDVQLVLMGSQGRGYIEEIFLGSVSHNVARQSEAPVLLIPAKRS